MKIIDSTVCTNDSPSSTPDQRVVATHLKLFDYWAKTPEEE